MRYVGRRLLLRTEDFTNLDTTIESLHWVWLHPYFRGRGILKSHWNTLRDHHGDFHIEHPLSTAMKGFLLKHNRGSVWYPSYEDKELDMAAVNAKLLEQQRGREVVLQPPQGGRV
jgi:hypothetical protein